MPAYLFAFFGVVAAIVAVIKSQSATTRVISVLAAVFFVWFGSMLQSAMAIHAMHGDMNSGVGQPYKDLIAHLKTLADEGKYNELTAKLDDASKHSLEISSTWLYQDYNEYRNYVESLIETNLSTDLP